jgi:hypothetical protein
MLMDQTARQNELLIQQQQAAVEKQYEADVAAAENLKEIELQQAKEEAERIEREERAKKGKRDLLYLNAVGVAEDDDDDNGMLLLGGDL